jgi:hypothetical protein
MRTFKDLEFKEEIITGKKTCSRARMSFENDYGISVIAGFGSYSSPSKPYEIAVLYKDEITYNTHITDDVIGHNTESLVTEFMKQIQQLS